MKEGGEGGGSRSLIATLPWQIDAASFYNHLASSSDGYISVKHNIACTNYRANRAINTRKDKGKGTRENDSNGTTT